MPRSLADVPSGSRVVVRDVWGGWGARRRLLEMGLSPGTEVEVVSNGPGPIVVRVRGVTVAVGRGLARKIIVDEVGSGER